LNPHGRSQRIFIPATVFTATPLVQAPRVCGLDYPFTITRSNSLILAVGAARLVSTPSQIFFKSWAWLGIGIILRSKLSPNLSSSTLQVSPKALNFLSPSCLPIPPRPHVLSYDTLWGNLSPEWTFVSMIRFFEIELFCLELKDVVYLQDWTQAFDYYVNKGFS